MPSSSHPLPSTLILLNKLPSQPPGTKVRFLGCVAKYSIKTGLLALEHDHYTHHHHRDRQHEDDEEGAEDEVGKEGGDEEEEEGSKIKKKTEKEKKKKMVIALVDITLVRENMNARDTMKGEWVNIVGYIQQEQNEKEKEKGGVRVQALMIWSAAGVRVMEYESAVEERKKELLLG